jgi:hypothetical protein
MYNVDKLRLVMMLIVVVLGILIGIALVESCKSLNVHYDKQYKELEVYLMLGK